MRFSQERLLRVAFIAGAVTDALALIPMLIPPATKLMWGVDNDGAFRFAAMSAASLMLGWTALLLWGLQRPVERRGTIALTVLVVYGLALSEAVAVASGTIDASHMIPTWCLQAALIALFAAAFHYPTALFRGAPADR
jgi:hypothetical protein